MPVESLSQIFVLLLSCVLVIALARRLRLPPILGYLVVGILLGPLAFGVLPTGAATHSLAEIGVVFLLFTIGLEFSWPRMVAMRREVFGLGVLQVLLVGTAGTLASRAVGIAWPAAIVMGGAIAMCSTAIVVQQLTDQGEINRTHGRLSFAVLLFQDLAFVPLFTVASSLAYGQQGSTPLVIARLVGGGVFVLIAVLATGRWLLRPLLYEIAHSRLRELFTLAALLVVVTAAWIAQMVGLSMALGAFLAGMMFAETEYRHQIDSVIRPFRELLLGLFFISVGMLLDLRILVAQFLSVFGLFAALLVAKAVLGALATRAFVPNTFKSARTGIVLAGGGEFGVALLTTLLQRAGLVPERQTQALLAALILSMIANPLIIRYNKPLARLLLRERGPPSTAVEREQAATSQLARREHVIFCGFGRVGRNIARVLELQGFEFIAIELDPAKVRDARQAGDAILWGDSADEELLRHVGLARASAVIVTFADASVALEIVRTVRRLRADVPVLVRTQDDARLADLLAAGATEVVPETLEASLTLASQALAVLNVPIGKVTEAVDGVRAQRYATLRGISRDASASAPVEDGYREELRSVVLPPTAWAVGRQLDEVRAQGAEVAFTAIRRQGITGREPSGATELREGDIVIVYGTPEALEHAESVLLTG